MAGNAIYIVYIFSRSHSCLVERKTPVMGLHALGYRLSATLNRSTLQKSNPLPKIATLADDVLCVF